MQTAIRFLLNPFPWLIAFAATVPFAKYIPRAAIPWIRLVAIGIAVLTLVWCIRMLLRFVRKPTQQLVFVFIIIACAWLLFEGLSWCGLRMIVDACRSDISLSSARLSPRQKASIQRFIDRQDPLYLHSPELGWDIRPDASRSAAPGSPVMYRSNNLGIRADAPTSVDPPNGKTRIFAIGDSFTFGSEVTNGKEWVALANIKSSRFEYVNLGVPGYGPVQATLRYKQLTKSLGGGKYVLVCFMPENIRRAISVARIFLEPEDSQVGMPYAEIDTNGIFRVVPNPMPSQDDYLRMLKNSGEVLLPLAKRDWRLRQARTSGFRLPPSLELARFANRGFGYSNKLRYLVGLPIRPPWGRDYDPGAYPIEVIKKVFDWTFQEIRNTDAEPVVLILPSDLDLDYYVSDGKKVYQPILDHVEKQSVMCFNATDFFAAENGKNLVSGGLFLASHYSEKANRIVGEHVIKTIEPRLLALQLNRLAIAEGGR